MNRALVIVHLSSLDAYAQYAGLKKTNDLAKRLEEAILSWDGPVYVIDQRWSFGEFSGPRWNLVMNVQLKRDINWIHFNDNTEDWNLFVRQLRTRLIRDGVKKVTLGGVWYDPEKEGGCVTDVSRIFKKHLQVKVDENLVGCWSSSEKLGVCTR